MLCSLPGTIFVYQGEELGLEQSEIARQHLQDPVGKAHWPRNKGRDGCRTPMPWHSAQPHAGFSEASPWLPVDARHQACAVDVQAGDPNSCLNLFRSLQQLRRAHSALRLGSFELLLADDRVLSFVRRHGTQAVWCVFNLSGDHVQVVLPAPACLDTAAAVAVGAQHCAEGHVTLQGWSALIAPLQPTDISKEPTP